MSFLVKTFSNFINKTYAVIGDISSARLKSLFSFKDVGTAKSPNILGSQYDFIEEFPNNEESAERLNNLTASLILRRMVSDVAKDLPDRIDIELPISLNEQLEYEYEAIRKETLNEYGLAGGLVATTRLSLFTAHPWLANRKDTGEEIDIVSSSRERDFRIMTPKLEITQNLIFEAATEGKKILVFSNYNAINEILFSVCNSKNISYWNAINGSTPQEERQEIINQFTAAPASAVLVLNPRAAGAGLNITAATVVIHFTPVWNPALEAQASARAHRRGQDKVVTIYKLYYVSTVEQVMIERSRFRRKASSRLLTPMLAKQLLSLTDMLTLFISIYLYPTLINCLPAF